MEAALAAHTLVAAHADRIRDFARLYDALERAAATGGIDGDATRDAYRRLCVQVDGWRMADLEAERRDVVDLAGEEREALRRDIARALAYAQAQARDLPPTARAHEVVRSLQPFHAELPVALPRAALVKLRRSAARLARIEALNGPAFLLGGEASVMLGALELASVPIAPAEIVFHASKGFHAALIDGLEACEICEPGAAGAVDLGLGASTEVAALLGVAESDLDELHGAWVESADAAHPFARYPFVPRGRLCHVRAAHLVRADLESTGPVGWAAGDDVGSLAAALLAIAEQHRGAAPALRAASRRIEAAAARGHAVIGLIEYLPPEAEGQRTWLVDPDSD